MNTGTQFSPRKFTWDMGVRKWGWSTNPIANDSPRDRLIMGTTTAEERSDIDAYFLWARFSAAGANRGG
jgi:hypothetical protein